MEPNPKEGSELAALPAEISLLHYTLKHVANGNAHLIAQCKQDIEKNKTQQLNGGDQVDAISKTHGVRLLDRLNKLELNQKHLESASGELSLIRHVLAYRELLESEVVRTRLRYERLNEEHAWLQEELKHFENKSAQEERRVKQLREQIAHYAFIYHQRHSWSDESIPVEMCALPMESESGQEPGGQMKQTIALMRSKLSVLRRIPENLTESLMTDFYNEASQDSEELTDIDEEFNKFELHGAPTNQSDPAVSGFGDTTKTLEDTDGYPGNSNASNSAKMTLLELRELMLGDNKKNAKKSVDLSATLNRIRMRTGRVKVSRRTRIFVEDFQLSDLEKETLKQCMKTIDIQPQPAATPTPSPRLDTDRSLEEVVEKFVRSRQRTENLATFVDLVRQFNHKETHSPGISLCWLAINSLKQYERELRLNEKVTKRKSLAHTKQSPRSSTELFKPGTLEEVEYRNALDDLCCLLNIVSQLYCSRNEMFKAAECLKDMLKIRRTTHTWKQASVAQALSDLASIQSNMKECNAALTNARKSLQLHRGLLSADQTIVEQSEGEFSVAKQAISLALMLMLKHQTEQKKLRYHRFPLRDVTEIPYLLNEAIRIGTTLIEEATNSDLPLTMNWEQRLSDRPTSTVGDCRGKDLATVVSPVEECMMVARNALAVYYVSTRKWTKAQKQLIQNLAHIDQLHPEDDMNGPNRISISMKMIKLICLKCLVHVYRITNQTKEQDVLSNRISKLDPFYRQNDELNEEEMIRFCQTCVFKNSYH